MSKPLEKLDIMISIFNQEEIIEQVLYGVFKNTTTPFNLVLVFDGCTDRTKPRAFAYIKKNKPRLLNELIIKDAPNLFELRANNFGFKLAKTDYLITLQDDMIIKEFGWERRLTFPLRKFDDVLAVTARTAQDIQKIGKGVEQYINRASREFRSLPRNVFAIRDVINRGPIAFRTDYLKEMNYLNDKYAPGALDDAELSLRAWRDHRWKVGSFWINYLSKQEWSKVNAPDSTMKAWDSWRRNQVRVYEDFKEYLDSGIKHDEDRQIDEREIDYIIRQLPVFERIVWVGKYPLRLDKRVVKMAWRVKKRQIAEAVKIPIIKALSFFLGPRLSELASAKGFKKAIVAIFKEKNETKFLSICIPTYEMHGFGNIFLKHSFNILTNQTFKDFDIIISDHSKTDLIKILCDEYKDKLQINYYKNKKNIGSSSSNLNNAIKKAKGKLIKILFQDDFLYSNNSLEEIVKNFDLKKDNWLVTACEHSKDGNNFYWPFYPKYNDKIHLGENTISSPSVLTIKNDAPLLFDEKLIWMMDCDYCKRCYIKFGNPKILNKINVVNRTGDHQISNTTADKKLRGKEYRYILKKYGEKNLLKKYDERVKTSRIAEAIKPPIIKVLSFFLPRLSKLAADKGFKKGIVIFFKEKK